MNKFTALMTKSVLVGVLALSATTANAWWGSGWDDDYYGPWGGGPWYGGGYPYYGGYPGYGWGGYPGYGYGGYPGYGGWGGYPGYGYGYPAWGAPAAPAAPAQPATSSSQ